MGVKHGAPTGINIGIYMNPTKLIGKNREYGIENKQKEMLKDNNLELPKSKAIPNFDFDLVMSPKSNKYYTISPGKENKPKRSSRKGKI